MVLQDGETFEKSGVGISGISYFLIFLKINF